MKFNNLASKIGARRPMFLVSFLLKNDAFAAYNDFGRIGLRTSAFKLRQNQE